MPTPSVPAARAVSGHGPTHHVLGAGTDGFVPRWRVTAPLVCVRDEAGLLHHCYRGDVVDYLADDQRAHFLRMNLVEPITEAELAQSDSPAPQQPHGIGPPTAPDVNPDVAAECLRDLDRLNVAPDAGAPTARAALRDAGLRYANDVIALAVRARKERLTTVPDSSGS